MSSGAGFANVEQRRALLAKALQVQTDSAACRACLDQLDDYVNVQLDGQDYLRLFPDLAVHLDGCPACAGAYALVYEVELGMAAQPIHLPAPDLSFLRVSAPPAQPQAQGLATRLRAALQRIGEQVTLQLTPDLFSLLRPAPALATTRAADARYGEILLALEPGDAEQADLPLTLVAYRDAQRPQECLVEVVVTPPGRSWPDLAGITVTLRFDDQQRPATTDVWGVAAFEQVPLSALPSLSIEASPLG